MSEQPTRKFGANNGHVVGWLSMALGTVTIVFMLLGGVDSGVVAAVAVVALAMAVVWSVILRPTVMHRGDDLVLRQPFVDIVIPLAAIDYVMIRLFMVVSTEDRAYHSSAFGRSRRQVVRRDAGRVEANPAKDPADLVEEQIDQLAGNARADNLPRGPITRHPAWLEIGLVGGLALVSLVLVVL